jgi:hypothetical protein
MKKDEKRSDFSTRVKTDLLSKTGLIALHGGRAGFRKIVLGKTRNGNSDGEQMHIYIGIEHDGSTHNVNLLEKSTARTDGDLTL